MNQTNALFEAELCIAKYNKKALYAALLLGAICFFVVHYWCIDTQEANAELLGLNTEFGISLSAFALSALAIIYALPSGETLERFRKTPGYYVIIISFKHAITWCLLNFVGGYVGRLLRLHAEITFNHCITAVSVALTVAGVLWVFWSVRNIFLAIQEFR